jgi:hypothetical protein
MNNSGNKSYLQGKFSPRNPSKYVGDINSIFYRSSWERRAMVYFDNNENVLQWSSEEIIIPYVSPLDKKIHRYFPDFLIKVKQKEGIIKTFLIEVKPFKQTQQPEVGKKVTKRYITEIATWGVNDAKWKAAKEYCADRNWEFVLITEKELNING